MQNSNEQRLNGVYPSSNTKEPRLPPELERDIFELAAQLDEPTALKLVLVAKRVQEWIEPALYRTLIKSSDYGFSSHFLMQLKADTVSQRDIQKASYCRGLLLQGIHVVEAEFILSICTNVTDLAMWFLSGHYTSLASVIERLRIQRLSIEMTEILVSLSSPISETPLARSLTHLDLINCGGDIWYFGWSPLLEFPRLTYLGVDGTNVVPVIEGILKDSAKIQLIVCTSVISPYDSNPASPPEYVDDPRFIHCSYPEEPIRTWLEGARGGYDIWVAAGRAQKAKVEGQRARKADSLRSINIPEIRHLSI